MHHASPRRCARVLQVALWCRCGASADGMSVVEPRPYAERFLRMIDRILDLEPRPPRRSRGEEDDDAAS